MSLYDKKAKQSLELEPRKPWGRREYVIHLGGFLILFVLLPLASLTLPIWDIEPIDDSDLVFVHEPVPSDQNGWDDLYTYYIENKHVIDDFDFKWYKNSEQYHNEITDWVSRVKIEDLLQILKEYQYLHPPHPNIEYYYWDGGMLDDLCTLLYCHKVIQATESEKLNSLEIRLNLLKQTQGGPLSLGGMEIWRENYLHLLEEIISRSNSSSIQSFELQRIYSGIESHLVDLDEMLIRSLLIHYQVFRQSLPKDNAKRYWEKRHITPPYIVKKYDLPFFYQRNRTHLWVAEAYRHVLFELDPATYPFASPPSADQLKEKINALDSEVLMYVLYAYPLFNNLHGRLIYLDVSPSSIQFEEIIKVFNWHRRALLLTRHLLEYEAEHGSLPATLNELNLPAELLLDPFNDQEIEYDPVQRKFSSVGYIRTPSPGELYPVIPPEKSGREK